MQPYTSSCAIVWRVAGYKSAKLFECRHLLVLSPASVMGWRLRFPTISAMPEPLNAIGVPKNGNGLSLGTTKQ
jgi:hypothetical protein